MIDRTDDYSSITNVLQAYFDGLYHADSNQLEKVFHIDARYVNTVTGEYINFSRCEYFAVVDQRQAPASTNEIRNEEILAIEFGGANMAFARVKMLMMKREYSDFLTLIFTEERWQIICKVFDYQHQTNSHVL